MTSLRCLDRGRDYSSRGRQMSFDDLRQQQRDELVRLKLQKLHREQQQYYTQKSRREMAELVVILLAMLWFLFKHPKTTIVSLLIGYGALQFFAPVHGTEFNRWVVTLCTNPSKARDQLLTTFGNFKFDSSTTASHTYDNSTVSSHINYHGNAPVSNPATSAPTPAPATVSSMCNHFSWSKPDDIPYLQYYKCQHPATGN